MNSPMCVKVTYLIYILITVVMYPFWNAILIFSFISFGYSLSGSIFKIKTYVPVLILIFLLFSLFKRNKKVSKNSFLLLLVAAYSFMINLLNSIFGGQYTFYDHMLNSINIILFVLVFLIPQMYFPLKIDFLEKILKLTFFISFTVVLFGFFEKIFISDDLLYLTNYYNLLGLAKGMEFRTYVHPVPDNLFSGFSGYRRMVSFVGEPLYLSYYLLVPAVWSFFLLILGKKRIFYLIFMIFFTGVILTISRNIILSLFISVFMITLLYTKMAKYAVVLSVSSFPLVALFFIVALNFFSANDSSFTGHMFSLSFFLNKIGFLGAILPMEDTILNNFLLLKYGGQHTVESTLLVLFSNLGAIVFCLLVFMCFKITYKQITSGISIIERNIETTKYLFSLSFHMAFPYILISYFVTSITSPHMITFQILFLLSGLSFMYSSINSYFVDVKYGTQYA